MELINAAAADVPDRAERFEAMSKEARRLQDHAGYETEIAIALGQRQFDKQHMVKVIETDDGSTLHQEGLGALGSIIGPKDKLTSHSEA